MVRGVTFSWQGCSVLENPQPHLVFKMFAGEVISGLAKQGALFRGYDLLPTLRAIEFWVSEQSNSGKCSLAKSPLASKSSGAEMVANLRFRMIEVFRVDPSNTRSR